MKARIKATGEIVEVRYYSQDPATKEIYSISYGSGEAALERTDMFELLPDEPETLPQSFDWETFRNETAAKLFLLYEQVFPYSSSNTKTSIGTTDELIRQLKETTMP